MKVTLINDTGASAHCGCMAVSEGHARMIWRKGGTVQHRHFLGAFNQFKDKDREKMIGAIHASPDVVRTFEDCDVVVCNGEGTIHHGGGLQLLAALAVAKQLGKKAILVNAVLQAFDGYDDILRSLDDIAARDKLSSEFLAGKGIPHRLVPDSCLEAEFSHQPLVDLKGHVVVTDWHHQRGDVGRVLKRLLASRAKTFYLPLGHSIHRYVWKQIPATMGTADVVVTARHHGTYMAALGGVPFVAMGSNTHKIEGFVAMTGFPVPVVRRFGELARAITDAQRNRGMYQELAVWCREQRPLSTMDGLGVDNPSSAADLERELAVMRDTGNAEWKRKRNHIEDWALWPQRL